MVVAPWQPLTGVGPELVLQFSRASVTVLLRVVTSGSPQAFSPFLKSLHFRFLASAERTAPDSICVAPTLFFGSWAAA